MVFCRLLLILVIISIAPLGNAQETPGPVAKALLIEEAMLSQDYSNRLTTFIALISNSDKFVASVDVDLDVFPRSADLPPVTENNLDLANKSKELPGFEGGDLFYKFLNLFKKDDPDALKKNDAQLMVAGANSPIDIKKLEISILLDESIANDQIVDMIQQNLEELIPYKPTRDGTAIIKKIKLPVKIDKATAAQGEQIRPSFDIAVIQIAGFSVIAFLCIVLFVQQMSIKRAYSQQSIQTVISHKKSHDHGHMNAELYEKRSIVSDGAPDYLDFSFIEQLDKEKQASALKNESPRIIAQILSHLSPSIAGNIFSRLPKEKRDPVAEKLLKLQGASITVIKEINKGLRQKVQEFLDADYIPSGGINTLANIVSWVPVDTALETITTIKTHDLNMALELSQKIFTFEKLVYLDNQITSELVQTVSLEFISIALEGASTELRDKFIGCMKPDQASLLEQMGDKTKRVSTTKVEQARNEILAQAKAILLKHNLEINLNPNS